MKPVVVRNIKRADNNAIGTLAGVGVSTAHEALGRSGLMKPYMRPIWAGAQIAGPAVTVLAQPGDNWMIHVAVEQCQKGDVLVVGCTTDNSDGMFGELLATAAIYDRMESVNQLDVPNFALAEYKAPENYLSRDCPLCKAGVPITRF